MGFLPNNNYFRLPDKAIYKMKFHGKVGFWKVER